MSTEPLPFSDQDLPTDRHRWALQQVVDELVDVRHLLLVAGSVAQRRATEASDIDLLVILRSSEACGGVASLAVGRVIDAAELHGVVSVTRYLGQSVKVSLRIMRQDFVEHYFDASRRHSIWKTHAVSHKRVTPEALIRPNGSIESRPFGETRSKGGYAYPLTTHGEGGNPVLNVESTMLLTSKVVHRSDIDLDAPAVIARSLFTLDARDRQRLVGSLIRAEYLDPSRSNHIMSLAD